VGFKEKVGIKIGATEFNGHILAAEFFDVLFYGCKFFL